MKDLKELRKSLGRLASPSSLAHISPHTTAAHHIANDLFAFPTREQAPGKQAMCSCISCSNTWHHTQITENIRNICFLNY